MGQSHIGDRASCWPHFGDRASYIGKTFVGKRQSHCGDRAVGIGLETYLGSDILVQERHLERSLERHLERHWENSNMATVKVESGTPVKTTMTTCREWIAMKEFGLGRKRSDRVRRSSRTAEIRMRRVTSGVRSERTSDKI